MAREISKFAVGDEITNRQAIRNWAAGGDKNLNTEKVYSVTEDHRGITYRTTECHDYHQELVIHPADAKKMALKFLAERMIIISESEGK